MISIVIPVKDGGSDLVRCLEAIRRQRVDEDVEIVVVDSGSSDGSPDRARQRGARVVEITAHEFNHGRTRNLGAGLALGDVLVFTTQDAYACEDDWLGRLVAAARGGEEVAGAYGRQVPHEGATPPERYFLDFLYGDLPRVQRLGGRGDVSYEVTLFSNVNAAMRTDVWSAYPFADDLIMSEDQEWSRRVLRDGYAIVYEPAAAVRHSHAYSVAGAFRRFFDSGASADRAYLGESRRSRGALRRGAARYALGEAAWLWRTGQRRWLPYAAAYEVAKFAGLQLGLRHRRLPTSLKRRFSALPAYWDREADGAR